MKIYRFIIEEIGHELQINFNIQKPNFNYAHCWHKFIAAINPECNSLKIQPMNTCWDKLSVMQPWAIQSL